MWIEVVRAISNLIAATIVAAAGLWIYFRQKEYELVKQRYLEQTLDVICSDLASLTDAFGHNWSRCLQIVRAYREVPEHLTANDVLSGFVVLNTSNFNTVAHYRLKVLLGTDEIWSLYQLALARYASLNTIVVEEIPRAVAAHLSGSFEADSAEIVATAEKELKPMMPKSEHFAHLSSALHQISAILERERLSFSKLAKFTKRKDVEQIIGMVRMHYATELSEGAL